MKEWKRPQWEKIVAFITQYRYVILMMAVGVVLLLWPSGGETVEEEEVVSSVSTDFVLVEWEGRLGEALSQIAGAGETTVLLTLEDDGQRILAQDVEESNGATTEEYVILTGGDKGEDVVALQTITPNFRGALIICQGGDSAKVQLDIIAAVSALTGLGSNQIAICTAK